MTRSICVTASVSEKRDTEIADFIDTIAFLVGSNPADYPSKAKALVKLAKAHPAYQQAERNRLAISTAGVQDAL